MHQSSPPGARFRPEAQTARVMRIVSIRDLKRKPFTTGPRQSDRVHSSKYCQPRSLRAYRTIPVRLISTFTPSQGEKGDEGAHHSENRQRRKKNISGIRCTSGYLCTAVLVQTYLWQNGAITADARFLSCAARTLFLGCVLFAAEACRCEYRTPHYCTVCAARHCFLHSMSGSSLFHGTHIRCSPALVSTLTLT